MIDLLLVACILLLDFFLVYTIVYVKLMTSVVDVLSSLNTGKNPVM